MKKLRSVGKLVVPASKINEPEVSEGLSRLALICGGLTLTPSLGMWLNPASLKVEQEPVLQVIIKRQHPPLDAGYPRAVKDAVEDVIHALLRSGEQEVMFNDVIYQQKDLP